jgi:hypothetical protein
MKLRSEDVLIELHEKEALQFDLKQLIWRATMASPRWLLPGRNAHADGAQLLARRDRSAA